MKAARDELQKLKAEGLQPFWSMGTNEGRDFIISDVRGIRRITKQGLIRDLIEWCHDLDILSFNTTANRTSTTLSAHLGFCLNTLITRPQQEAFTCKNNEVNPLLLTERQKIFFLYALFYSDGYFYIPFINCLPKAEFNARNDRNVDADGRRFFSAAWRDLVAVMSKSKQMKVRREANKINSSLIKLDQESFYQRVKSKLEALVDIDLLTKDAVDSFTYQMSDDLLKLRESIPPLEETISNRMEFLNTKFFSICRQIFAKRLTKVPTKMSDSQIESTIIKNYLRCVSGLSARIDNVALLSSMDLFFKGIEPAIEIVNIKSRLVDWNKEDSKSVSLHVDLYGNLSYVKIASSFINSRSEQGQ